MKTNSQVVESWVMGRGADGHHIFTDGYTIYSYGYHFPLARKMANGKIMLNASYYSSTTARHQANVRSAIINNGWCDRTILCYSMDSEENTHEIKSRILNTIKGIPNCRKIEKYTTIIRDEIGMLKKFKDAIGESCPKWVGDILFVVSNLKGKSLKTWAKNYKLA
jgi:hypothetical protein